jgi:Transposase and inactivated derivatives
MPRCARNKISSGIYHIMIKSISEVLLFKNHEDKEKYLKIVKKQQDIFKFKVYSYCLMSNHGHFLIDCNGADISNFMHVINQSYAIYFNKKYTRIGHLFNDRFKSVLIKDNLQLLLTSAYIHNNAKDIDGYKQKVENYKYSSLGFYLGLAKDNFQLVEKDFILQQLGENAERSVRNYFAFVKSRTQTEIPDNIEFKCEKSEYRSERKILVRDYSPEDIIPLISKYTGVYFCLNIKYNHSNHNFKCLCVVIMRSLCNFSYKEICSVLGNINSSNLWYMCNKGLNLINEKYCNIIHDLVNEQAI